jgi:holo-[acyl-carrier protein] synthase
LKVACGTDIIEISRVKKSIEHLGDKFVNTVYTENEIAYCESHLSNKYQHYAARFAAKEAAYKAMEKIENVSDFKKFEIVNREDGKPEIRINNDRINSVDISLSHCKEYAVANVVILYE